MSKRKFYPGDLITSVAQLVSLLEQGRHVYFRHKFTHCGWARSWQLWSVLFWVKKGYLREAVTAESLGVKP